MKKGFIDYDTELIEKYGKVVGMFEGTTPILMINDPKILKHIFIKDFNSFVNHRVGNLRNLKEEFECLKF